jgi:hypothetical protein
VGETETDAGGQPDRRCVKQALIPVHRDLPELFGGRHVTGATGSSGSRAPVLEAHEKPLSRKELERMSPEQVNSCKRAEFIRNSSPCAHIPASAKWRREVKGVERRRENRVK